MKIQVEKDKKKMKIQGRNRRKKRKKNVFLSGSILAGIRSVICASPLCYCCIASPSPCV